MCIEVRFGPHVMVFDAGSGLRSAGQVLRDEGVKTLDLFISHWHYDHVLGMPFFAPLYDPQAQVTLWSGHDDVAPAQELLSGLMRAPYFPVGPSVFRASLTFRDFRPPQVLFPAPGITVRTLRLNHPGGSTAYRIEAGGRVLCFVTDVEHVPQTVDADLVTFVQGADMMLYDSTFEDSEMGCHCGFGHSTWQQALRIAQAADVARVGFVHHSPSRTDDELLAIEQAAIQILPGAFVARQDGQVVI